MCGMAIPNESDREAAVTAAAAGAEGWKFLRQKPIGPFVVDFACVEARLAIEIDGATHSTAWEIDYDRRRTRFLEREGWGVLRFWNSEIFQNLDGVVETIRNATREQENWPANR